MCFGGDLIIQSCGIWILVLFLFCCDHMLALFLLLDFCLASLSGFMVYMCVVSMALTLRCSWVYQILFW